MMKNRKEKTMNKPVYYLQTDPHWAKLPYAAPGESATIGGSGCGPTAMAMVVSTFTPAMLLPDEACKWALSKGFKALNQGTYYSYFPAAGKNYGVETAQITPADLRNMAAGQARTYHDRALNAIKSGDYVIACMGKGLWTSSGHFVVWYGCDSNYVYINDPNSTAPERLKNTLARFQSEVKHYFISKHPLTVSLTPQEAVLVVKASAGLEDETIEFLHRDYKYGDALVTKLAAAMKAAPGQKRDMPIADAAALIKSRAGLDDNTMFYLSRYAYSDPLIAKLAAAML
jgi:hypothetical protein